MPWGEIMRYRLFVVLLLACPSAQLLANDALLDQALARQAQPRSAANGIVITTHTMTGGDEPEIEHETVDLKKKPDEVLASYGTLKDVIGTKAKLISSEGGRSIYRFRTHRVPDDTATPKGVKIDDKEDMEFEGTAEVIRDAQDAPYISHLQLHMRHAAGPLIGRVKTMDIAYGFAPAVDGTGMVATDVSVDVNVRALFFIFRHFSLASRLVMAGSANLSAVDAE